MRIAVATLAIALLAFLTTASASECQSLLSCDECTANACAWCISTRRCVPDVAWQCTGDVDHIGRLTGRSCPSREQLAAERAAQRAAREAAAADVAAAAAAKAARASAPRDAAAAAGLSWSVSSAEHAADLAARAAKSRADASGKHGSKHPYETLLVEDDATAREIRRAYLALSARLHPDRNPPAAAADAGAAFADVSAAYELLSDAAAREAFDGAASGGRAFFNDEQSFAASGQTFAAGLYEKAPLVTELTEGTFATSFTPGRIWLLIFYAPWCGHCQQSVPMVNAVAETLADDASAAVDVGAVNCARHAALCSRHDIRGYPSFRLAAGGAGGLAQELPFANAQTADAVTGWVKGVASEWRWLLSAGDVTAVSGDAGWDAFLANTSTFALVLCVDAAESGPARTARTNLLRLAASVGPARAAARVVDCDAEDAAGSRLCARLGLPAPPFAPILRALPAGPKANTSVGEALFSPADVEAHVALAIVEAVLRLAVNVSDAASANATKPKWDKAKKEDKDEDEEDAGGGDDFEEAEYTPPERPKLQWSGPPRPPSSGGFHGGGSAPPMMRVGG